VSLDGKPISRFPERFRVIAITAFILARQRVLLRSFVRNEAAAVLRGSKAELLHKRAPKAVWIAKTVEAATLSGALAARLT